MDKSFQKIIGMSPALARFFTYLVFFLVPLVFFKNWMFPFNSSKLLLFFAFSGLAFFFTIISILFRPEYRLTKKLLFPMVPIVLLIGSLGLSSFLAPLRDVAFWSSLDRGDGWFFLFHLLLLIFSVFVLILKDQTGAYKKNILLATLGSAGIVALTVWLGNEGFNIGGKMLSLSQGGGTLGNSSFTATYLLFAVFLGLMVFFSTSGIFTKNIRRFALGVAILIALSPIIVNFDLWSFAISFKSILTTPQILLGSGRGVAVGIVLGVLVALVFRMIYAQKKLWKIVGVGVVVFSFVGYLGFFVAIQKDGNSLQTTFTEQAGGNRLIFWNIAWQAISEKPILGWGLENFRVPFHRNFDPALLRVENSAEPWVDRTHNIFYDMTVAGGYAGLLFFLLVVGSLVWGIYYAGKKRLIHTWSSAFLFGGIYAYLFQGLFVFDTIFSYLMLGLLYAFIFGLIQKEKDLAPMVDKKTNVSFVPYKIYIASILALGVLTSVIFIAIPLARTASLYGKIIATPLLERTSLWSQVLEDPVMIRLGADLAWLALYTEIEYGKKRSEIFSEGNQATRKIFADDFQIMGNILDKSALLQSKHNHGTVMYMTLNTAARIYNSSILLLGQKNERLLEKAWYYSNASVAESPTSPQVYWILAQTLILQNKISEADGMLEKAIVLDPYNRHSHRVSIQTANSVGDKKAVIRRIERAKQYIPDFSF